MFGFKGDCEVIKVDEKVYLVAHYGSPRKTVWIEVNPGLPADFVKVREEQRKEEERRLREAQEDAEFNKLFNEEMQLKQGKIRAVMGEKAAEVADETRKDVEKRLGRKLHGKFKSQISRFLPEEEE